MNGFAFFKRLFPSYARKRLDTLVNRQMILDLATTSSKLQGRVVRLNLGFGPELWLLNDAKVELAKDPKRVENAKLLVYEGRPGMAIQKASEYGIQFEKVWVRW